MRTDWQETFMDRRDALTLFDEPRGRNREKPWPLLPILAFIAPGGSGKSTLINICVPRSARQRSPMPISILRSRVLPKTCCRSCWSSVTSCRIVLMTKASD